jgi:Tfp pilus assembly protein PilV
MTQSRSRRRRTVLIVVMAAALAFAAYAFTASNTVPTSQAGDGYNTISGYTVTNVAYVLAANPANIDRVTFTLSGTAGTVKAKVQNASTTYADCSNTGGNNWSCDFATDPTVLSADELRVIAVQ